MALDRIFYRVLIKFMNGVLNVNVERIDLMSFGRIFARPIVMAEDLSRRHKSDDFNSFLIHLFF